MKLKTYKDLRESYEKFCSLGSNKKLAKFSYSTVNAPLFEENDDVTVIEKCVIPELHILQGFVNHIFWDGLVKLLGRDRALLWPKHLNVIAQNYHGEIFEGNACRKMIKNSDFLLSRDMLGDTSPLIIVPYVTCLKLMDKIVNSCFSNAQKVDSLELQKNICDLRKSFASTGVSVTLKVHVLLNHVLDALSYLNGTGLGIWSEQAGESVHHDFLQHWNRYLLNNIDDERYGERLCKAVVEYSSSHV